MAASISLMVSREISICGNEDNVSSVLEFSLYCSNSSAVLEMVWDMISFTLRFPRWEPCVFHVCGSLSQAPIISLSLSR